MFTASLLALALFACCFASLTNNAPSHTLVTKKGIFTEVLNLVDSGTAHVLQAKQSGCLHD